MSVETNSLTATKTILAAVKTALQAVEVGGSAAFGMVELFDLADWGDALRRLATAESRVALVVYAGEQYENTREVSLLTTHRVTQVEILMTDFQLADPTVALIGDDIQPGALGLVDAVLPALTGILIDTAGNLDAVHLVPTGFDRMILTQEDQDNAPGRHVIGLTFEARGAYMQIGVGESSVI